MGIVRVATVLALLLIAALLRAPTIGGPGYALDEEITVFAVRGIQHAGLPLFPSGVLSDRGLPFSYAAWLAGAIGGHDLQSYRIVSFVGALAAVLGLYLVARRLVGHVAAAAAGLLLAIFPVHVAVSGWARFYALAVAVFIASIALLLASQRRPQLWPWFVGSVALSVLLHELCVVLVALPFLFAVTSPENGGDARRWTKIGIWCVAVVGFAKLAVVGLHFLAPNQALNPWRYQGASVAASSRLAAALAPISLGGVQTLTVLGSALAVAYIVVVIRRKVAPIFLAVCLLAALLFQLGVLAAATLIAVLLRPDRARVYLTLASVAALASAVFWTVHTSLATSAALKTELFLSLFIFSVSYPLQALIFFITSLPLTSTVLAAVALATALSWAHPTAQPIRVLSVLIVLSLVSLSVLDVALNSRYYLVFWAGVLLVAAYAIDGMWRGSALPAARGLTLLHRAAAIVLVAGLAMEHHAFSRENPVLVTGGNPPPGTIERVDANSWSRLLSAIPRDAIVISNDELAAVYHLGRVDYWLTTSDWDLARYELVTTSGRYSEYAGARVVASVEDLAEVTRPQNGRPAVLVLFRTGRFEFNAYRQMALEVLRQDPRAVIDEARGLFVMSFKTSRAH